MGLIDNILCCLILCIWMLSGCYRVEVEVTKKTPNESQSNEHIDLTTSSTQEELVAYIESLKTKKDSISISSPSEANSEGISSSNQTDQDDVFDPSSALDQDDSFASDDNLDLDPKDFDTIQGVSEDVVLDTSLDQNGSFTSNNNLELDNQDSNTTQGLSESSYLDTDSDSNSNDFQHPSYQCHNPYIPSFIEHLSSEELSELSVLIDNICNKDSFIQFFNPDFGWQGNPSDRRNYSKIFQERQIGKTKNYEFIIGMSFLLPELKSTYIEDVFKAYTDNDWFALNYKHPDNMDVKIKEIRKPLDIKGFDIIYNMSMSFSISRFRYAFSFASNFIATRLSKDFTVFTERSLPNKSMKRVHISFLNTVEEHAKFTVFETRVIDSKGIIGVAKAFMNLMDSSMMKAVYDNAIIQQHKEQSDDTP